MRKAILDHNSEPTTKNFKNFTTVDDLLEILTKKSKPNLDPFALYNNSIARLNTVSCPICMEYFNPWQPKLMVVSCCFKMFHSKCLNSLHRLTNASETSCPCCRQSFSAVKVPSLEISFHIITRAVNKIRAYWKGYYLRVKNNYDLKHLRTSCTRISHLTRLKTKTQEKFLDEIDQELENQKALIKEFEQLHIDWENVRKICLDNNHFSECAICMESMKSSSRVELLSCSHCFHSHCLKSWTNFSNGKEICPLCRNYFFMKDFHF